MNQRVNLIGFLNLYCLLLYFYTLPSALSQDEVCARSHYRGTDYLLNRVNWYERDGYEGFYMLQLLCCSGYIEISRTSTNVKCRPLCSQTCIKGKCIKPETCLCNVNHYLKNNFECAPICQPSCINGNCVDVNKCECHSGYRMVDGSNTRCEPICENSCENGDCVSPGMCECKRGYIMKEEPNDECDDSCQPYCLNGSCITPGYCQCLDEIKNITNNKCEPVCPFGCGTGTCLSPNNCTCPEGYKAAYGEPCKPICSNPCDNGYCVAPDECICSTGYIKKFGKCVADCDEPCINSTCILPNTCACLEGFTNISNSECAPECNPPCSNGECISPDTCSCHLGYNFHPEDSSNCLPKLGHPSGIETSYLNTFYFSNILTYLEDNSTLYLKYLPQFALPKPCSLMFQNISSDSDTSFILSCLHLKNALDDIQLYCKWPNEKDNEYAESAEINLNTSDVPSVYLKKVNSSITWNLTLHILFPQLYNTGENGSCTICLHSSLETRYLSLNGSTPFTVTTCNYENSDGLFSNFNGTYFVWLTLAAILIIVLTLIIGYYLTKTLRSGSKIIYVADRHSELNIMEEDHE